MKKEQEEHEDLVRCQRCDSPVATALTNVIEGQGRLCRTCEAYWITIKRTGL